jgi:O-methyltransferase
MDNFFITRDFDWQVRRSSNIDRALNIFTRRFKIDSDTAGFVDRLIYKLTGLHFSPTRSGLARMWSKE